MLLWIVFHSNLSSTPCLTIRKTEATTILTQGVPNQELLLRATTFIDMLLIIADPKLGVNQLPPYEGKDILNNPPDQSIVLEDLFMNFFSLKLTDITISNLRPPEQSLEYHNLRLINIAYVVFYKILDQGTNFALSKYIDNGFEVKNAIAKRFLLLRENGFIHEVTNESSDATFSTPPISVIAAFCSSHNPYTMTTLFESLLISSLHLNQLDLVSHVLSARRSVRHLNQTAKGQIPLLFADTHRRLKAKWNEFTENSPYMQFAPPIDGKPIGRLTLVKLKHYMLRGNTRLTMVWCHFILDKIKLKKPQEYYADISDIDSNSENKQSPYSNSHFKKVLRVQSYMLRNSITRSDYDEAIKILDDPFMLQREFNYAQTLPQSFLLREHFSALLRLHTLDHPSVREGHPSSRESLRYYFHEYDNEITSIIERYSKILDTPSSQNSNNSATYPTSEIKVNDFLHFLTLKMSKTIYESESDIHVPDRQERRFRAIHELKELAEHLPSLRLLCTSPQMQMLANLSLLRYKLFSSLAEEARPDDNIIYRLNNIINRRTASLPIYNMQFRILRCEYNRQCILSPKITGSLRELHNTYLREDISYIDEMIHRNEIPNRTFEMQWLACFLDYNPETSSELLTISMQARWLVM